MLQAQLTSQSLPLKFMSGTLVSLASTGVSGLDVLCFLCGSTQSFYFSWSLLSGRDPWPYPHLSISRVGL